MLVNVVDIDWYIIFTTENHLVSALKSIVNLYGFIIKNTTTSGEASLDQLVMQTSAEDARYAQGVRGHAPLDKFWNIDSQKRYFQQFDHQISGNSLT
jgi:hypothetical protein